MQIFKSDKIKILNKLYLNEDVDRNEFNDQVIFDLLDDDLAVLHGNSITVTYFGFLELKSWDPILEVTINDQLIKKPYGDT